jgi:small subunit ribosomal protein S6
MLYLNNHRLVKKHLYILQDFCMMLSLDLIFWEFVNLMALYECTFVARQDLSAQDAHKFADKLSEVFSSLGSEVLKREYWGLRLLSYEVKKNAKGHYMMLGVKASVEAVAEFERQCKISEDIIKYMTIKVEKIDEQPSIMMQAPAKAVSGAATYESAV